MEGQSTIDKERKERNARSIKGRERKEYNDLHAKPAGKESGKKAG